MAVQPIYATGTATVTADSDVVTGTNTAWGLALVNGGTFSAKGRSIPIIDVVDDTHLTLAYPAPADMAGDRQRYAVELGRADIADTIVANRKLSDLIDILSNRISPFARALLDDDNAAQMRDRLGVQQIITKMLNLEVGSERTTAGAAYVDLHSKPGGDFDFRLIRDEGDDANGSLVLRGQGLINLAGGRDLTRDGNSIWHNGNAELISGYSGGLYLPNGLMIQWGTGDPPSEDNYVYFKRPFKQQCSSVIVSPIHANKQANVILTMTPWDISKGGFRTETRYTAGGPPAIGTVYFCYIAIGF